MKATAELIVHQIPVDEIDPSASNPRRSIDPVQLEELAQSIRSVGVQVPLALRLIETPDGQRFEIVGGERRWHAAQLAGLETVPAIVREMTDAEARDAGLIENLQRADLDPLDEAEAYAGLLVTLGSVPALAARVGKPIETITRSLRLRSLTVHSADALRLRLITIDHALLLAKLGDDEQNQNLKWTLDHSAGMKVTVETVVADATKRRDDEKRWHGYWQPQSVLNLKQHIEQHTGRKLASAPWDLAATNLDADGIACLGCPSNTDDNRALFSDMNIAEATCANGACWAVKQDTFVHIQMGRAGDKPLRLSWKHSEAEPRMDSETGKPSEKPVLRQGQWIRAKAGSCANLRKGVTVDFEEGRYVNSNSKGKPGEVLQVCITPKCKAHPKAYETREKRSNGGYDPVAEKKKREERAALVASENKLRLELAAKAIDKVTKLPVELLRALLLELATRSADKRLRSDLKSASFDGAAFAKAVATLALSRNGLEINEWNTPESERKEFLETLKTLGVDGRSAWEKKSESKPDAKPAAAKKTAAKPAKKAAKKSAAKKKGGAR